jgi:RNA recognition motif-containing protein
MKRLYVGNLAPDTTAAEVGNAFSKFGRVLSVTLAEGRQSGRHRAFGYVEMEDGDSAAIAGLNRKDLRGQPLTVCAAIPKAAAPGTSAATPQQSILRTQTR